MFQKKNIRLWYQFNIICAKDYLFAVFITNWFELGIWRKKFQQKHIEIKWMHGMDSILHWLAVFMLEVYNTSGQTWGGIFCASLSLLHVKMGRRCIMHSYTFFQIIHQSSKMKLDQIAHLNAYCISFSPFSYVKNLEMHKKHKKNVCPSSSGHTVLSISRIKTTI